MPTPQLRHDNLDKLNHHHMVLNTNTDTTNRIAPIQPAHLPGKLAPITMCYHHYKATSESITTNTPHHQLSKHKHALP